MEQRSNIGNRVDLGSAVLFAPADVPRRTASALRGDADSIVVDLEDAVADGAKAAARRALIESLAGVEHPSLYVRVNAADSGHHGTDLEAVAEVAAQLAGVVLPKAESVDQVEALARRLDRLECREGIRPGGLAVVPVIESPRGVLAVEQLACAPRVVSLIFGTLDLAAALGVEPTVAGAEFLHARSRLVLASRAAGIAGPIDGPHALLDDDGGLADSSRGVRALGFRGRVVLHPRQIATVRREFGTSDRMRAWARSVVDAFDGARAEGRGAVRLPDGTFVDRPVVARAVALLDGG